MKAFAALLAATLALPAAAAAEEAKPDPAPRQPIGAAELLPQREVPKAWHAAMADKLPTGQKLVQTLVGDLDGDGKDEWIGIGEPEGKSVLGVSVAIFHPAQGKKPPELRFAQRLIGEAPEDRRPSVAGASVVRLSPIGQGLLVVAADPRRNGNSRFIVQIYGTRGERFVPLVPEELDFHSQGGFAIEDLDPSTPGHEIATWTYVFGPDEQLFDRHRYRTQIYRWKGRRWVSPDYPDYTSEKLPSPADAARSLGVKGGDMRRLLPRVAEVP